MIITLLELGIWAGYSATKYTISSIYYAGRYAIYGYIPTKEELEKQVLLDRIGDLEEKVNDLESKDVLSAGDLDENLRVRPNIQTTIRYECCPDPEVLGGSPGGQIFSGAKLL